MDDLDLATIADERNEDAAEDARDRARLERKPAHVEPNPAQVRFRFEVGT